LLALLSAQIDFVPVTTVDEAENELSKVAHNTLTSEQKETKKLVKRIIRGVQPLFEDALRKEADMANRPVEKLLDLETILEQKLQSRHNALSVGDDAQETIETNGANADRVDEPAINGVEREAVKKADEIQLAPTPDDNAADNNHSLHDEATDEAAIAAQLGQDALHASNGASRGDAMELDNQDNTGRTEPLTPPRSEKNLLNPLHNGGIPWYLEPFDIHGTTVHEERWAGREVLRDMSEDLSELDDDELDGLADSDPIQPNDAHDADVKAIELRKAAARKRQRRSRAYR
jgi:NuA3 HAT complex component NTO1